MKTNNGIAVTAVVSAIILLAAMPASAQLTCGKKTGITNCYSFTPQSKTYIYGPMSASAWLLSRPKGSLVLSATATCGNCPNPLTEPDQVGDYVAIDTSVTVDGTYGITACLSTWDTYSDPYLLTISVTDAQGDGGPIHFGTPGAECVSISPWVVGPPYGPMSIQVMSTMPNVSILVTVTRQT